MHLGKYRHRNIRICVVPPAPVRNHLTWGNYMSLLKGQVNLILYFKYTILRESMIHVLKVEARPACLSVGLITSAACPGSHYTGP